jgi:hypothetical protein
VTKSGSFVAGIGGYTGYVILVDMLFSDAVFCYELQAGLQLRDPYTSSSELLRVIC